MYIHANEVYFLTPHNQLNRRCVLGWSVCLLYFESAFKISLSRAFSNDSIDTSDQSLRVPVLLRKRRRTGAH